MKIKKTVTAAVLKANRENADNSTGAKTRRGKSHSSHNAVDHGLLARNLVFQSDAEKQRFREMLNSLRIELSPKGAIEEFMIQAIAFDFWNLSRATELITEELNKEHEVSDCLGIFHHDLELPVSGRDLPVDKGWDCEQIIVRAITATDNSTGHASSTPTLINNVMIKEMNRSHTSVQDRAQQLEINAVLTNRLTNMTRYLSAWKRDLYKDLKMLQKLRSEQTGGVKTEVEH